MDLVVARVRRSGKKFGAGGLQRALRAALPLISAARCVVQIGRDSVEEASLGSGVVFFALASAQARSSQLASSPPRSPSSLAAFPNQSPQASSTAATTGPRRARAPRRSLPSHDREAPDVSLCNIYRQGCTSDAARVLHAAESLGSPADGGSCSTVVAGF